MSASPGGATLFPTPSTIIRDRAALLGDIKGGLIASVICLVFSVANGALIYSASMPSLLPVGILLGLLTSAVTSIVIAVASGFRPVLCTANSATAAPLGAIMATLAPALAQMPHGAAAATVFALVAVATLATGAAMLLIGLLRRGRVVRFVPFPVVAGFMGVTGTLLLLGAIRFGTGVRVVASQLPQFLLPEKAILLTLTIAFAVAITLVVRRFKHPLTTPALLLGTIFCADGLHALAGFTTGTPAVPGLFLLPAREGAAMLPVVPLLSWSANWSLIAPLATSIAAYVALVIFATLLTSTGIENALNVDADYDRELRAQGLGCIASGLLGGFVGNPTLGSTVAAYNIGGRSPLTGISQGLLMLLLMPVMLYVIPYVPRFVIGGFLAHIGYMIVMTWCVATRRRMPAGEWLLVLGIVAITVWVGMVPAVTAGLIAGCVLFAIDVSRINIVQRDYGLDARSSILTRGAPEISVLSRRGRSVRVVELGGMLFFGSAYQVLARIRTMVELEKPHTVVLDFTRVVACDSSAVAVIARMRKLLAREKVAFAVAGAQARFENMLRTGGCLPEGDRVFPDRNQALEAGETMVLSQEGALPQSTTMQTWLSAVLDSDRLAETLMDRLVCRDHDTGSYVCRTGDRSDQLFFIESGRIEVLAGPPDAEVRVRILGGHTVAGEHAFVLGLPRSASLRAEQPTRLWLLERVVFDRLLAEHPDLAIAVLRNIIRDQSERLGFATRQNAVLA